MLTDKENTRKVCVHCQYWWKKKIKLQHGEAIKMRKMAPTTTTTTTTNNNNNKTKL